MGQDDGPDDDGFAGPPLPPEDRLWRHPSEVAAASRSDPRRLPWLIPGLVGLALGGAAVVAASAFGGDDTGQARGATERVAVDSVATVPVAQTTGGGGDAGPSLAPVVLRVDADDRIGSAVLYRDDGHLLTSAEVVDGADRVAVIGPDGSRAEAEVLGVDEVLGLAVLWSASLEGRAGITLGRSDDLRVGDPASASMVQPSRVIARPGVVNDLAVSTVDRSGAARHGLVRVDTPSTGGPGGGAIIGRRGDLLGITLGADPSPATFAVPVDIAVRSGDQIVVDGRAVHPWLGLEGADLDEAVALELALPGAAVVSLVAAGGPAAGAGLAERDVIVAIDGEAVHSMASLVVAVRDRRPGEAVTIRYLRGGRSRTCSPVLSERPA